MNSGPQVRRLFLLATVLPAAVVVVDWCLLNRFAVNEWPASALLWFEAVLVAQIALLSWTIGRWLTQPVLCWVVYMWNLVLVDLWLLSLVPSVDHGYELGYALISGQIGMIAIWAILGTTPWQWRLPSVAIPSAVLFCLCFPLAGMDAPLSVMEDGEWAAVLLVQAAVMTLLSLFLRLCGFRIERPPIERSAGKSTRAIQFTIGQALLWTTAFSQVFALGIAIDWSVFRDFRKGDILPGATVVAALVSASAIGMWSALGKCGWLVRSALMAAGATSAGAVLACLAANLSAFLGPRFSSNLRLIEHVGLTWIAWTVLASGFLAAMLLILRSRGYRLVRGRPVGRAETGVRRRVSLGGIAPIAALLLACLTWYLSLRFWPKYAYDGSLGPQPPDDQIQALVARADLDRCLRKRDAGIVCEVALRIAAKERGTVKITSYRQRQVRFRIHSGNRYLEYECHKAKGTWWFYMIGGGHGNPERPR